MHGLLTVEGQKREEPSVINREDGMVHAGRDRDPMVGCAAAQENGRKSAQSFRVIVSVLAGLALSMLYEFLRS